MIKAGLAYPTIKKYGDNGFPGLARMILEAWKYSPTPKFENPEDWRAKNQKKLP